MKLSHLSLSVTFPVHCPFCDLTFRISLREKIGDLLIGPLHWCPRCREIITRKSVKKARRRV